MFGLTRTSSRVVAGITLAAALWGPARTTRAASPAGSEFQVNVYITDSQMNPRVASGDDGAFVVVWHSSPGQDGSLAGVFGRRFTSAGTPIGGEFQVNTYTLGQQMGAAVAMDPDGDFVVVWTDGGIGNYPDRGVRARRFSSSGDAVGDELEVQTVQILGSSPEVAMDADGDFVIAWSDPAGFYGPRIFARQFSSSGSPLADPFLVDPQARPQGYPAVAAHDNGDFVVVWTSTYGSDGALSGVFARRFLSTGLALGTDFQVNTYTLWRQENAAVGVDAAGGFVVVWQSYGQVGDSLFPSVHAQRFSGAGVALGAELEIASHTAVPLHAQLPAVAVDADGGFVATWNDASDGHAGGIRARRFSSAGAPLSSDFQVNTYTIGFQSDSAVAASAEGGFVVAWLSRHDGGGGVGGALGVFAQRFAKNALDVDGDGELGVLTDELLLLRSLFGLTGPAVVSGVLDADCTRCDEATVAAYVSANLSSFDIDGNGEVQALTDGLLIIRRLSGLTGAALTAGAVEMSDCTRCTPPEIETYFDDLIP